MELIKFCWSLTPKCLYFWLHSILLECRDLKGFKHLCWWLKHWQMGSKHIQWPGEDFNMEVQWASWAFHFCPKHYGCLPSPNFSSYSLPYLRRKRYLGGPSRSLTFTHSLHPTECQILSLLQNTLQISPLPANALVWASITSPVVVQVLSLIPLLPSYCLVFTQ